MGFGKPAWGHFGHPPRECRSGFRYTRGALAFFVAAPRGAHEARDRDPEHPWEFRFAPRRKPLTDEQLQEREGWAGRLLREHDDPEWYYRNITWWDFMNTVIPGGPRKAAEQVQFGKSKKRRLMSPGARTRSADVAGTARSQRQASFGDRRVWYVVAMARGVYMARVLVDKQYTTESQEFAVDGVAALAAMLDEAFPGRRPRTLFSDRGPGFYHQRWGHVTPDYSAAVAREGLVLWAGNNAKTGPRAQPADVGDVLLHETANSWLRTRLDASAARVTKPWGETDQAFAKRVAACVKDINQTLDVKALCRDFPKRLRELKGRKGDRLDS